MELTTESVPSSSTKEITMVELADFIDQKFPESKEFLLILIKLIRSTSPNDAIQNEVFFGFLLLIFFKLIDMLGLENFNTVEKILYSRISLSEAFNESFLQCKKLRRTINEVIEYNLYNNLLRG